MSSQFSLRSAFCVIAVLKNIVIFQMKLRECVLLILATIGLTSAMSRQQLKKTLSIMKNQCINKIGVPESKVAKIESGQFIEDHDVMCYVACMYKNMNAIKNDRLDYGLVAKQVDILFPPDLKDITKKGAAECISTQDKYSDMCEAIFYAAKCLYEFDPPSFIFP